MVSYIPGDIIKSNPTPFVVVKKRKIRVSITKFANLNSNLKFKRKSKVMSCNSISPHYLITCKLFLFVEAQIMLNKWKAFLQVSHLEYKLKTLNQIATQLNRSQNKLLRKLLNGIRKVKCEFLLSLYWAEKAIVYFTSKYSCMFWIKFQKPNAKHKHHQKHYHA